MIDTSPTAVERRATNVMVNKHHIQMAGHQRVFGQLGELQTQQQKRRLKAELKKQAGS